MREQALALSRSLPTTESSASNINASTYLPQYDGPRIAMIGGGWIFRKDTYLPFLSSSVSAA